MTWRPQKIFFVIASMASGGAARIVSIMANYWVARGKEISIAVFDEKDSLYELDGRIRYKALSIAREASSPLVGLGYNLRRISIVRREILNNAPDVAIAFIDKTNVLTLLSLWGSSVPVLVSERNDPRAHSIGKIWTALRALSYPYADAVIVQTSYALSYFSPRIQRKSSIIPNPVTACQDWLPRSPSRSERHKRFSLLAVGKLRTQKGFDLLLRAYRTIASKHPEWSLTIWGEGQERASLERLRDELGLQDCVSFPGRTPRIYQEMRQADLFVLSSRFEGFPNALCEAMAAGLPAIAFNCPGSLAEIVRNNVDGVLVDPENIDALANALSRLMGDVSERAHLARRAPEITKRFSVQRIMAQWEKVLENVSGR